MLAHLPVAGTFGMGLKCPDWQGALLCYQHHAYADGEGRADWKFRFTAMCKTWTYWIQEGLIKL